MSRIGRLPVVVPKGVEVDIEGTPVCVSKGPKAKCSARFPPSMQISINEGVFEVSASIRRAALTARLHGMTRALINNMVVGVSTGFERILEVNGVGYRAEMQGKNLVLYVGYSHPVVIEPPQGISFEADAKTRQIKVMGYDKAAWSAR